MEILLKLVRMSDGTIHVYTMSDGETLVHHGHWDNDPKLADFITTIKIDTKPPNSSIDRD